MPSEGRLSLLHPGPKAELFERRGAPRVLLLLRRQLEASFVGLGSIVVPELANSIPSHKSPRSIPGLFKKNSANAFLA